MNPKVKKQIIEYCKDLFKTYVPKDTLKQYNILDKFFLEMLYNYAQSSYLETGDFALNTADFEEIFSFLRVSEETLKKFQEGKILLIGVDEFEQFHFNYTPQLEAKYNEEQKIWEENKQ